MRYVYLDETIFNWNQEEWVGYGALLTDTPVCTEIIENAIEALKEQRSANNLNDKINCKTINNGFFHANKDSSDAHSVICKQIRNINAEFRVVFFKNDRKKLLFTSLLAALEAINSSKSVLLVYENRNDLKQQHIDKLYSEHETYNLINTCNKMFMPIYYPQICYKKVNKQNPGIQIVDFILWAYQRKLKGKDDWYSRIKDSASIRTKIGRIELKSESFDDLNYSLTINEGVYDDNTLFDLYLNLKPLKTDNISDSDIINILEEIYLSLIEVYISNLFKEKETIQNRLYGVLKISDVNPGNILITFLRIFDMVPYLNPLKTKEDNIKWLTYKKIVAETINIKQQELCNKRHKQFNLAWVNLKNKYKSKKGLFWD